MAQEDPMNKQARRRVAAEIGYARREMEDLAQEAQHGHSLGRLLRRRVELQHRIRQLRDKEERLRRESFVRLLIERGREDRERRLQIHQRRLLQQRKGNIASQAEDKKDEQSDVIGAEGKSVEKMAISGSDNFPDGEGQGRTAHTSAGTSTLAGSGSSYRRKSESSGGTSTVTAECPAEKSTSATESDVSKPEEVSFIAAGLDKALLQMIQASERRVTAMEAQAEAARRAKDERLRETNRLREESRRRFELVDDMYTKAIERRMRAMRRIAADPPADRLIGHSAAQHVPLSMLTKETRKLCQSHAPGAGGDQSIGGLAGVTGLLEMHRSNVFLTGVDAGRAEMFLKDNPENSVEAEINGHCKGQSGDLEWGDGGEGPSKCPDAADLEREAHEELLRQWRELGYTAVYLPATRRLAFPFSEGREGVRKRRDPYAWMQLNPLPVVHLIQRRLPETPLTRPVVGVPKPARSAFPPVNGGRKLLAKQGRA